MSHIRAAHRVAPLTVLILAASALWLGSPALAGQGPVGLGTADSFAVLAGSGITNTGPTTITGDVGTFPTPSETGFGSITLHGTNHAGDAVTQGAKVDLVTAYNDAAGRNPATSVAVELGGTTLRAGVYASPTLGLTGTLTLDAQGVPGAEFIFQAASTLITAPNSRVLLVNGADPCHVVWQVGSSATFDTGTRFTGDVLAQTSISALTGAVFQGRLLARDGAVTLDTNTITNAACSAQSSGGTTSTTTAPTTTAPTTAAPTTTAPTTAGPSSPTTVSTPPTTRVAPVLVAAVPGGTPPGTSGGSLTTTPGAPGTNLTSPPGAPGTNLANIPGGPRNSLTTTPISRPPVAPPTGTPPPFAFTGASVRGLLLAAVLLIGLGLATLRAARRDPTGGR